MLIKKEEKMMSKRKKKGFTLIELIVVIAILGILAAIAIPRFSSIQSVSLVKSDAATALEIVNAARVQNTDTGTALSAIGDLTSTYMIPGTPQSGGAWALSLNASSLYEVTWTPTKATGHNVAQTVTEGTPFAIK